MERKMTDWGGSIAAFLMVLVVNYLSNIIPLGGQTQKQISDKYASLFTPDSFTFAIWGVIYLAIAAFVVYQALPAQRKKKHLTAISYLFMLTCVANITWMFAWHYEFLPLSLVIMLMLLGTLIILYRTIDIHNPSYSLVDKALTYIPFSLYLAWITVATIANISILQTAYGWDNVGITAINWTLLKLAIVAVIAAVMILLYRNWIFGLVVAWACYGIASKQVSTPEIAGAATLLVVAAILLISFSLAQRLLTRRIASA